MEFTTYFRASSYATIAVAALALVLAGGLHAGLAALFAAVMVFAWIAEGRKWQLSERVGLVLVLLSIPLFFVDWHFQKILNPEQGRLGINSLAHLIVFLSAIKLLQVKADRDWVFLYLISFFEVLLAAGLSFSPVFLATLSLYLLCTLSTVIAFEIKKATASVKFAETRLLVPPDSRVFNRRLARRRGKSKVEANWLPLTAFLLLSLIFVLALPLFLVAPRAASPMLARSGGLNGFIGFSESVALGDLGTLKRNDQIVMRVRLEGSPPAGPRGLRWRGIALDEFSGRFWRKSAEARFTTLQQNERGTFRIDRTDAPHRLTTQTVFLEPLDTSVLFAAPRPVLVQGDFSFVRVDAEGSMLFRPHETDRLIYKVLSDTTEPAPEILRQDRSQYAVALGRYLQLPPKMDPRIRELANQIIIENHARNRYDTAVAIESYLRNNYGYSLDRKATGEDPLADFLFNVRAGHCEYFSTAMVVMLRSMGVAARVVNGFLPGEYNEAAAAYTVRQSDAHSWAEVYFPASNSWVVFDPTPQAGRVATAHSGLTAWLGKYAEALELVWFQYVVGYDKQEQRALATSLHNRVFQYQRVVANLINTIKNTQWVTWQKPITLITALILVGTLAIFAMRMHRQGWSWFFSSRSKDESQFASVEFYRRLTRLLEARGLSRSSDQTPLEFAMQTGLEMPLRITHAYHRVRYGSGSLSPQEANEIERWLKEMEGQKTGI